MIDKTGNEKWIFIVNPTSGGGYGKEIIPVLEKQLSARTLDWVIVETERHGHASELSEQYLKKGFPYFIHTRSQRIRKATNNTRSHDPPFHKENIK